MASLINRQIIFPGGRTNAKQCNNGGRKSMRLRHHQEVPWVGAAYCATCTPRKIWGGSLKCLLQMVTKNAAAKKYQDQFEGGG